MGAFSTRLPVSVDSAGRHEVGVDTQRTRAAAACRAVAQHALRYTPANISIRCSTIGRSFLTGLHLGTVVFDTHPEIEMRMHCPACQKDRWWTCTGTWVIESPKSI